MIWRGFLPRFIIFHGQLCISPQSPRGVLAKKPRSRRKLLRRARQTAETLQNTDVDDVKELRWLGPLWEALGLWGVDGLTLVIDDGWVIRWIIGFPELGRIDWCLEDMYIFWLIQSMLSRGLSVKPSEGLLKDRGREQLGNSKTSRLLVATWLDPWTLSHARQLFRSTTAADNILSKDDFVKLCQCLAVLYFFFPQTKKKGHSDLTSSGSSHWHRFLCVSRQWLWGFCTCFEV